MVVAESLQIIDVTAYCSPITQETLEAVSTFFATV